MHFLHDFEKVKKWIFADIFWRRGPMTLLMCGKKTYDPSGFSPEILFDLNKNWRKYSHFKSVHFFFDYTVLFWRSNKNIFFHHANLPTNDFLQLMYKKWWQILEVWQETHQYVFVFLDWKIHNPSKITIQYMGGALRNLSKQNEEHLFQSEPQILC